MTIEICSQCKGEGIIWIDEGTHSSDYVEHGCTKCMGTGRVQKLSINLDVEIPFGAKSSPLNELDSKLYDLIRKVKLKNGIL